MKISLNNLKEKLNYECLSGEIWLDRVVDGAYVSDLLSDVMGKAQSGMLWITSQVHKNIVAVASLKELSAIIVVNERKVDLDVLEQAELEEVVILASKKPAFETAGELFRVIQ
ncbi:DRTGG domain [Proteiniphilum saccharofermentans]|uniref:DRTGG domain n=1 Tax=Proteiniphilum saccharofermentans TaxID=1642647 RepID=A0A1R3TDW5_9BACT|nr:hypothetical protein [Proteiniphilum saccharofermentans]SCD21814.1 DRTGG domain [Proteiniphilum saccharofermentans]